MDKQHDGENINQYTKKKDSMWHMITEALGRIPFRSMFIVFVLYLLVSTEAFISLLGTVNSSLNKDVDASVAELSDRGYIVAGLVLVFAFMVLELATR